jgi:hypothetical protein
MTRITKRVRLNEKGQSTVEFALTLILLMSFVLFYIQLSMVMAFGNYVHYATFMAARAYLSAGSSREEQTDRATQVIIRMLKKPNQTGTDRFGMIGKGFGGGDAVPGLDIKEPSNFVATDPNLSWLQGVRYSFKSRLFMIPMAGSGPKGSGSANSVTLKSESWLGREPNYDECQQEMKSYNGIFDNGC